MLILVVEDNPAIRELLITALSEEGYSVAGAQDGQEALELLPHLVPVPALIVLDLMMPRMDGWAFRVWQRAQPQFAGIPVIVLSAASDLPRHANDLGVSAFLAKPLVLSRLLASVDRVLSTRNA